MIEEKLIMNNVPFKGRYKFELIDKNTKEVKQVVECDNIITGSADWAAYGLMYGDALNSVATNTMSRHSLQRYSRGNASPNMNYWGMSNHADVFNNLVLTDDAQVKTKGMLDFGIGSSILGYANDGSASGTLKGALNTNRSFARATNLTRVYDFSPEQAIGTIKSAYLSSSTTAQPSISPNNYITNRADLTTFGERPGTMLSSYYSAFKKKFYTIAYVSVGIERTFYLYTMNGDYTRFYLEDIDELGTYSMPTFSADAHSLYVSASGDIYLSTTTHHIGWKPKSGGGFEEFAFCTHGDYGATNAYRNIICLGDRNSIYVMRSNADNVAWLVTLKQSGESADMYQLPTSFDVTNFRETSLVRYGGFIYTNLFNRGVVRVSESNFMKSGFSNAQPINFNDLGEQGWIWKMDLSRLIRTDVNKYQNECVISGNSLNNIRLSYKYQTQIGSGVLLPEPIVKTTDDFLRVTYSIVITNPLWALDDDGNLAYNPEIGLPPVPPPSPSPINNYTLTRLGAFGRWGLSFNSPINLTPQSIFSVSGWDWMFTGSGNEWTLNILDTTTLPQTLVFGENVSPLSFNVGKIDSMVLLTNLSSARYNLTSSTFGDGGVVFGGGYAGSYSAVVDYYEDVTHTRTTLTNLSSARDNLTSSTFGDGGVAFGGGQIGSSSYSAVVDYYEDVTHTRTTLTRLSSARDNLTSSTFGDGGVVFGGGYAGSGRSAVVDYYEDVTHTRTTLTNLSSARDNLTSSTFGDGGVVFGGGYPGSGRSAVVDYYEDVTHTRTTLTSLSTARYGLTSSTFGDGGVAFGGGQIGSSSYSAVVDYYSTDAPLSDNLKITSITTTPDTHLMLIGETFKIITRVSPHNAIDTRRNWISSNPNVAIVSQAGYVTSLSVGTTTITVSTNNGKTDTCLITVLGTTDATLISATVSDVVISGASLGTPHTNWSSVISGSISIPTPKLHEPSFSATPNNPNSTVKYAYTSGFNQPTFDDWTPQNIANNGYLWVEVTATDTTTKLIYAFKVVQQFSTDATLSSIKVAGQEVLSKGTPSSNWENVIGGVISLTAGQSTNATFVGTPTWGIGTTTKYAITNSSSIEPIFDDWTTQNIANGQSLWVKCIAEDGITELIYRIGVVIS